MSEEATPKRGVRARAILGKVGRAVLLGTVMTAGLVGGALIAINTETGRSKLLEIVESQLNGSMQGDFELKTVDGVGLGGIDGLVGTIAHPDGTEVIQIDDAAVGIRLTPLITSLWSGEGPLAIELDRVDVNAITVNIGTTASGELRLAEVFASKDPTPSDPNARPIQIEIPSIVVRHLVAKGAPAEGYDISADVTDLAASVSVKPDLLALQANLNQLVLDDSEQIPGFSGHVEAGMEMGFDATWLDENSTGPAQAHLSLNGAVRGSPVTVDARVDGAEVNATTQVRDISQKKFATLLGDSPLLPSAHIDQVNAEVSGTFPRLLTKLVVVEKDSRVEAKAALELTDEPLIDGEVVAENIDLSDWLADVPASSLSTQLSANVRLREKGPQGSFELSVDAGTFDGMATPSLNGKGTVRDGQLTADVEARHAEAEADVNVAWRLPDEASAGLIKVQAEVEVPNLSGIPGVAIPVSGSASLKGNGQYDFDSETIEADATLRATAISNPSVRVNHAMAKVRLAGPAASPSVDLSAQASGINAAGVVVDRLTANANGPLLHPRVQFRGTGPELPAVSGAVSVDLEPQPRFHDGLIRLKREQTEATISVASVTVGDRGVDVAGVKVTGLGGDGLTADLSIDGDSIHANVQTEHLEMGRVVALVPWLAPDRLGVALDGEVGISAKVDSNARGVNGRLQLSITDANIKATDAISLERVNGEIDLTLIAMPELGQRAMTNVSLSSDTGSISLVSRDLARLGGPALQPQSWKDAVGRLAVDGDVELSELRANVTALRDKLQVLDGRLSVAGSVDRHDLELSPSFSLKVKTNGLAVTTKEEAEVESVAVSGIDVQLQTACSSRLDQVDANLTLVDATGPFISVSLQSVEGYKDLIQEIEAGPAALREVPFRMHVNVPQRELSELPKFVQFGDARGTISGDVWVQGTAAKPEADVEVAVENLRFADHRLTKKLDVDLRASYHKEKAELALLADVDGDRRIRAFASGDVPVALLEGTPEGAAAPELPWNANAEVEFLGLPLSTFQGVAGMRIGGMVRGRVELKDLHQDASLTAKLRADNATIGDAKYDALELDLDATDGKAEVVASGTTRSGHLTAEVSAPIAWGSKVVPTLESGALSYHLDSKRFPLGVANAFTPRAVTNVQGLLYANINGEFEPKRKTWKADGFAKVRRGSLGLAALGEPLENIEVDATVAPDGTVDVGRVIADVGGGIVHANATLHLDSKGLRRARAALRIEDDEEVPLVVQGSLLGHASGRIQVEANMSDTSTDVAVNVSTLTVKLPYVAGNDLQKLEPSEHIEVGRRTTQGFETISLLPPSEPDEEKEEVIPLRMKVSLNNVEIIKPETLRVWLHGTPSFVVGSEVAASGSIVLDSGDLTVQGRQFEIESGTVTFAGGPPDNPSVVATASWEAPDGTIVYADFVGPLQTGKVTLRSEPARPKPEILSLIAFGSVDGLGAQGSGQKADRTTQAIGLTGGFATQGLNAALGDVTSLDIRTRVDTSNSNNPRPEVEVAIARDISVAIAHVLGTPSPGNSPDKNYASIEWRFAPRWSVETTVGDQGSSAIDLLWQLLY